LGDNIYCYNAQGAKVSIALSLRINAIKRHERHVRIIIVYSIGLVKKLVIVADAILAQAPWVTTCIVTMPKEPR
jgi:hypothetical protein